MKTKQLFIGSILTLLLGGSIYVFFRALSLKMFSWFVSLGINNSILKIRSLTENIKLPDWILFSLPDGLWIFSFISFQLFIWNNKIEKGNCIWLFCLPMVAIISEIGQLVKIVPGTFDSLDLVMYLIGTVLPFFIYNNQLIFKHN